MPNRTGAAAATPTPDSELELALCDAHQALRSAVETVVLSRPTVAAHIALAAASIERAKTLATGDVMQQLTNLQAEVEAIRTEVA